MGSRTSYDVHASTIDEWLYTDELLPADLSLYALVLDDALYNL